MERSLRVTVYKNDAKKRSNILQIWGKTWSAKSNVINSLLFLPNK